ncbi:hypothetical protein ACFQ83_44305, partial [Streptomyces sp. NPDC056540]
MSTRWSKARPLAAFPRPAPRAPPDRTKALAENEIAALWRLDVALWEKMLEEIPRLNVEDLHPGDERGRTLAKGGATEWIHWHSGTAQKVDTPAAWKQARAAGMLQAAQGESSGPMAVAPDGSSVIAASRRDGRVTLVWLRDQGRERTTIYTVADSARVASALADFDGRWLVFNVLAPNDVGSQWELLAWDSRAGGAPKSIAETLVGADGNPVPGPFTYPWVNDGKATWVQGVSDGTKDQKLTDVQRQVHLYDLASATDKIVHTGRMAPSFFTGGHRGTVLQPAGIPG